MRNFVILLLFKRSHLKLNRRRLNILCLFFDISGLYQGGCAAFAKVSPNVVADESVMKTDEGMTMEQRYTVVRLACFV